MSDFLLVKILTYWILDIGYWKYMTKLLQQTQNDYSIPKHLIRISLKSYNFKEILTNLIEYLNDITNNRFQQEIAFYFDLN